MILATPISRSSRGLLGLEARALGELNGRLSQRGGGDNNPEFFGLVEDCIGVATKRMTIGEKLNLIGNELSEHRIDLGLCGVGGLRAHEFIDLVIYDHLRNILGRELNRKTGINPASLGRGLAGSANWN